MLFRAGPFLILFRVFYPKITLDFLQVRVQGSGIHNPIHASLRAGCRTRAGARGSVLGIRFGSVPYVSALVSDQGYTIVVSLPPARADAAAAIPGRDILSPSRNGIGDGSPARIAVKK